MLWHRYWERRSVMLTATYNINNINTGIGNLVRWRKRSQPDIVCLGVGHKVPNASAIAKAQIVHHHEEAVETTTFDEPEV